MIEPHVSEANWLEMLQDSCTWTPPHKPTIVVSPHPDDETLGAGGLIAYQAARGAAVSIVAVTDGEAAYENSEGLADVRQREQEQAVAALGVSRTLVRLRLPDSAVAQREQDLRRMLAPLIAHDSLVVSPWANDWHPDHEACGRVATKLCKESGAEHISYLFWAWHRRTIVDLEKAELLRFELCNQLSERKRAALACHVSQLNNSAKEAILPPLLLQPAFRSFETFVSHAA